MCAEVGVGGGMSELRGGRGVAEWGWGEGGEGGQRGALRGGGEVMCAGPSHTLMNVGGLQSYDPFLTRV